MLALGASQLRKPVTDIKDADIRGGQEPGRILVIWESLE